MKRRDRRVQARVRAATLAAAVAVLSAGLGGTQSPAGAAGAAGTAGPGFGSDGLVVTPLRPSSADFGTALALQPDGQVVIAAGAGGDFGLARFGAEYLYPGDILGPQDARVTTDFGGTDDVPRAVALTPTRRVVAAGSAGGDVAVARYEYGGVLDRSFDGDGRVTVDLGGSDDSAYALAVLPDDRVDVVGGRAASVSVIRLLPDGRPDGAFGSAGRVTIPSAGPGRASALQPDGKLLVAGGGDRMTVYRFLVDGGLDPAFGVNGVASIGPGPATVNAMVLGPDGSITLAGTRGGDVVVARIGAAGQPDGTFGTGGVTVSAVGGHAAAYALARRDDGALMVAGDAGGSGLLVRYTSAGLVDPTFGSGGHYVTTPDPLNGDLATQFRAVVAGPDNGWIVAGTQAGNALLAHSYEPGGRPSGPLVDFGAEYQRTTATAVQTDGKVVAVAEAGGDVAVVRYNPDGTRDAAFGVAGIAVSDRLSLPRAVAVQPNGRIVVAGVVLTSTMNAAMVGFRPDGALDTTFGDDGRATADPTEGTEFTAALDALPDGRLLLLGQTRAGDNLLRFTPGGQPDATFGTGGVVRGVVPGYPGARNAMAVQADGRVLVLAETDMLFRFNADGTADGTFGAGGTVGFAQSDPFGIRAFALQPDGRILVAGGARGQDNMEVQRLLPDGTVDASWKPVPTDFRPFNPSTFTTSTPSAVAVEPDGGVVLVGVGSGGLAVARLHADGTLDRTFGTGGLILQPENLGAPAVLVLPTAASGLLTVATAGTAAFPTDGLLLARIATGPLGAPTGVTAEAGSGSARVRWSRPPLIDESPVVAYAVTASDGVHSTTTPNAGQLTTVVTGLAVGRSYTFTVHAVRVGGSGPSSAPSNAVVPGTSGPTSAWGWNGTGQLGDATTADRGAPVTSGMTGAVALAGGAFHSVALRADGTVWTWGWNGLGALGDGSTTSRATARQVPGLSNVVAVAAGALHSLALRADGTVWAWGWNGVGQLGTGTTADSSVPVPVRGLSGITAIGAGFYHSLAVRSDGSVVAWGWNALGQLGDGSTVDSPTPKPVPGLAGISAVAGGALHSLALGTDGKVRAWGWNGVGQLGTGDTVDRLTPTVVGPVSDVKSIAAGAFHNYALLNDGTVRSWGWNAYGQLGNPSVNQQGGILSVWNLDNVSSIAAGWYHGLAVRNDGSVVSWGADSYGQLGDGLATDRSAIATVKTPRAVAVGAGAFHSLSA